VSAGVGLAAGGVTFIRAARSLSPAFAPTETREHLRWFVGPEARLSCAVASPIALVVTLGLDVVVNAPRFEVITVPGRSAVYGLADFQPRLGIGLEWSRLKYR
jgi:hypothetical protein